MGMTITFPLVSQMILNYGSRDLTQDTYISLLFGWLEDVSSNDLDKTNTNKWINGKRDIPAYIVRQYTVWGMEEKLAEIIKMQLLPKITDPYQMEKRLNQMIMADTGRDIGNRKRKDMLGTENLSQKLAKTMILAVSRKGEPVSRWKSPDLSDCFFGVEVPDLNGEFVGREEELQALRQMLRQNGKVFVYGIGGIGKSELVRRYAGLHQKEYRNMFYLSYDKSLRYTLTHMACVRDEIGDSDEVLFERHYRLLQGLAEDSLIIIDNFDVLPDKEPMLQKFLRNRFQVIFTTRKDFQAKARLEVREIEDSGHLLKLFHQYYRYRKNEESTVLEIIDVLHKHTLTVELAAMTLGEGYLKPQELLLELVENGLDIPDQSEVTLTKDDETTTSRMYRHIQKLFHLQKLPDIQKECLKNLALLPLTGIYRRRFSEWMEQENYNVINGLVKHGWIKLDSDSDMIYIHGILRDLAGNELKPSVTGCRTMLEHIRITCLQQGKDITDYNKIFECILSILSRIEVDDSKIWILFLEDVFGYMDKYCAQYCMEEIVQEMDYWIRENGIGTDKDIALLLDYRASLCYMGKQYKKAIKIQKKALKYAASVDARNAHLASNLYANLGSCYLADKQMKEAKESMDQAVAIVKKYRIYSHDLIMLIRNYGAFLQMSGDLKDAGKHYQAALKMIAGSQSRKSSDYGLLLADMGSLYGQCGKLVEAEKYYLQAEKIMGMILPPDHVQLKGVYSQMANLYQLMGVPDKASEYRNRQIQIEKKQ